MSDENREKAHLDKVCRAQVRRDRGHGKKRCSDCPYRDQSGEIRKV